MNFTSRLLCLLFMLMAMMVLPSDTSEEPLIRSSGDDDDKENVMRWEVLNAITNRSKFDHLVRQSDVYQSNLWERYKNSSSSSERSQIAKKIYESVTDLAYAERTIISVGMKFFGQLKYRSYLRSVRDPELPVVDDRNCLKCTLELFIRRCGLRTEHGLKHLQSLANMCNYVVEKKAIKEAFKAACPINNVEPSVVDVQNPSVVVTPSLMRGPSQYCGRISVNGISRLKNQSYNAKSLRVSVVPPTWIPHEWHKHIHVCFHRDALLGLCRCKKDEWEPLQNGVWESLMSSDEQRFVDVKFTDGLSEYVTITLEKVSHRWPYVMLLIGIVLLFMPPVVSKYIFSRIILPFMAPGVSKYIFSVVYAGWVIQFVKLVIRVVAVTCIFPSSIAILRHL